MKIKFKKIMTFIPILGFLSIIVIIFYLMDAENSDLRIEINNLYTQIEKKDSINTSLYSAIDDYQKILDSIKSNNNDCPQSLGFELNGRTLSSDELFDLLFEAWEENDSLTFELSKQLNYMEYIRLNWGLEVYRNNNSYSIQPKNGSRIDKNEQKLIELEALIRRIEVNYPIKYKINRGDEFVTVEILPNQLDTAMYLYPYFKDRIKKEKNGYAIIK